MGEKEATGAVPVPVSERIWGLPEALSATFTEPDCVAVAVGVKVTLITQFAPAFSIEPQLFVWAKFPLAVMP